MSLKKLIKVADYYNVKYGFGKVAGDDADYDDSTFHEMKDEDALAHFNKTFGLDVSMSDFKDSLNNAKENDWYIYGEYTLKGFDLMSATKWQYDKLKSPKPERSQVEAHKANLIEALKNNPKNWRNIKNEFIAAAKGHKSVKSIVQEYYPGWTEQDFLDVSLEMGTDPDSY
jgi:hypothetical protein